MDDTRIAKAEQAVLSAAIAWSVHHSPIEKPYDDSPAADRARATYSARSERNLHEAVAAMLAEIDAALAKPDNSRFCSEQVLQVGHAVPDLDSYDLGPLAPGEVDVDWEAI